MEQATIDTSKVDAIVNRHGSDPGNIISILQDIQEEFNYVPEDVLTQVTEKLEIPLSRAYSLATFFKAFSLTPRGRHPVSVCMGTACHVLGGHRILRAVERELGIKPGETTPDYQFSLEAVRCLGCCALAPVVTVGPDVYGKVSQMKIVSILNSYRKSAEKGN